MHPKLEKNPDLWTSALRAMEDAFQNKGQSADDAITAAKKLLINNEQTLGMNEKTIAEELSEDMKNAAKKMSANINSATKKDTQIMIEKQANNRQTEGTHILTPQERTNLAVATDFGSVRDANEDMVLTFKTVGHSDQAGEEILVIADGMGGHAAGEVAAELTVKNIQNSLLQNGETLQTALKKANHGIHTFNTTKGLNAGSTVTAAKINRKSGILTVYNAGDSPAYVYRNGELIPVFYDDSKVAELVRNGELTPEKAYASSEKNVILNNLGANSDVLIHVTEFQLHPGDMVLLASDGIEYMSGSLKTYEDMIKETLGRNLTIEQKAQKLIELAKNGGGGDNISVIIREF